MEVRNAESQRTQRTQSRRERRAAICMRSRRLCVLEKLSSIGQRFGGFDWNWYKFSHFVIWSLYSRVTEVSLL